MNKQLLESRIELLQGCGYTEEKVVVHEKRVGAIIKTIKCRGLGKGGNVKTADDRS